MWGVAGKGKRGVPTHMLVKNQKIRKVIVCKLCLFFPKSKNTMKRKHTQTNLTRNGEKWPWQQLRNLEAGISGTGITQ